MIPPVRLATWEDPDAQYLVPSRFFGVWFGFWPWETANNENAERLARKLVELFGEVEDFFSNGSQGPHLRRINQRQNVS